MTLYLTGLIAFLGATALIFGIRRRRKSRWMIAVAIIGGLVMLAMIVYSLLAFIILDFKRNQPMEEPPELSVAVVTVEPTQSSLPVLSVSPTPTLIASPSPTSELIAPMLPNYDLPVSEVPELHPDILGLRNAQYEEMPTFGTQNEVSKFVLWNFLNDCFEFEFFLRKEIVPDEGSGFCVLNNACVSAMTYYLFGAYDMFDMYTKELEEDDKVYARIKLIYTDPDLDAEARAEALEFVLKNPVPNDGFEDFESEKAYARKIHDFIAKKVTYSPKGYNPNDLLSSNDYEALQEAYNVLGEDQNEVVCAGYARAFALIAQYAGINAVWVSGNETETESHAWNVIYPCDGSEPVLIDVTWDDTGSEDLPGQEFVSDRYFYINLSEDYEHHAYEYVDGFLAFVNE